MLLLQERTSAVTVKSNPNPKQFKTFSTWCSGPTLLKVRRPGGEHHCSGALCGTHSSDQLHCVAVAVLVAVLSRPPRSWHP